MFSEYISSVRNAGVSVVSTDPTHCDCKSRQERERSCSWRRLAVRSSRWSRTRQENRRETWRHGKHLQLRRTATSHGMCDVTIKGFEGEALERELTVRSGCHECFLISSSAILTEYCNKCEYNHNTHHLQSPYTRVCLLTRQKTNALASKTHKGNFTWQKMEFRNVIERWASTANILHLLHSSRAHNTITQSDEHSTWATQNKSSLPTQAEPQQRKKTTQHTSWLNINTHWVTQKQLWSNLESFSFLLKQLFDVLL